MKHREQGDPSYSEAQATAWLAWLARRMQQHGQTIFLIEQLQPSWLSTRRQRWVYILTSRLIWGIVSGLIVGLFVGLLGGLIYGLIVGLIVGLSAGLSAGLIDVARFARNHSQSAQNASSTLRQIIAGSLLYGLIGGLIAGLIGGLADELGFELLGTLMYGLIGGLIIGLIWMLRSFGRNSRNEIQTVETIRFSWAYVPKGIGNGLIIGLIIGLISGLIIGLIYGLLDEWLIGLLGGLIYGLTCGLIGGLIGGLMSCFRPGIRELKTDPNQGIRLSLRTASLMGSVGGLGLGLIVGLLLGWPYGLAYGALGGLCIGLWYGGLDVIQHYIVRFLLCQAGVMPRNYARFLDYAAEELNFLQKVGGGYIFVHRYLLEYFAAMELPKPNASVDKRNVAQPAGDTA